MVLSRCPFIPLQINQVLLLFQQVSGPFYFLYRLFNDESSLVMNIVSFKNRKIRFCLHTFAFMKKKCAQNQHYINEKIIIFNHLIAFQTECVF